jgi:hypothetical protein
VRDVRHNQFPHRRNQNGFYDSICGNCFVTIGSRNTEDELEPMEKAHICDQTLLDQRKAFHEAWKTRRLD